MDGVSLGRVPHAVLLTHLEDAELLMLGSGASVRDGLLEGDFTRTYLAQHWAELVASPAFDGLQLDEEYAKARVMNIIELELLAQNTAEELEAAAKVFCQRGITRVILVSSPSHVSRCLRDAKMIFAAHNYHPLLFASPCRTCFADVASVLILEPPHRPFSESDITQKDDENDAVHTGERKFPAEENSITDASPTPHGQGHEHTPHALVSRLMHLIPFSQKSSDHVTSTFLAKLQALIEDHEYSQAPPRDTN